MSMAGSPYASTRVARMVAVRRTFRNMATVLVLTIVENQALTVGNDNERTLEALARDVQRIKTYLAFYEGSLNS